MGVRAGELIRGFPKVINTVTTIVDKLPPDLFEAAPTSPPSLSAHESTDSLSESFASTPVNAQEVARNNIIREIVETERKYVQDLEVMQVRLSFISY
jgi:cell division control protein 24